MTLAPSFLGIALAFGGGLVSFMSPCVLPLVPGYVAWIAGADLAVAQARPGRTLLLATCFVLGFSAVFVALGTAATGIGSLLRRHGAGITVAGGAMVAVFGLVQLGLLRLPLPLLRDLRPRPALAGGTPGTAALLGAAFGFGWTPCIGPVLGGVLAAAAGGAGGGVLLLSAYALGLGMPFLLAAFYLRLLVGRTRRFGGAGRALQAGAGAVMVLMGVALMSGELTRAAGWLLDSFPVLARFG